jgi:hypothetical protein
MDSRLIEVFKIFQKVFEDKNQDVKICELEIEDCQFVEVGEEVTFTIEEDKLAISFHSNCRPDAAALFIQDLYKNGVTDFEIYENILVIQDTDGFPETLFGALAEGAYFNFIYESIRKEEMKPSFPLNTKICRRGKWNS